MSRNCYENLRFLFRRVREFLVHNFYVNGVFVFRCFFPFLKFFRFTRETRVVVAGIARCRSVDGVGAWNNHALRRSIHRLEKGLLMRPRAAVFAEDYIVRTVESFETSLNSSQHDLEEILWAAEVLESYFSLDLPSNTVREARQEFERIIVGYQVAVANPRFRVPRGRGEFALAHVKYEEFVTLCRQRRSVRWFLQRPVPEELIHKALIAALQAPSACNRQPFFFRYFDDPKDAARIADIAMGTTGYAHQIPALLVLLGDWSCFEDERDRHLPYIDGSLAAMQLMLALETLGLASCPINWPDVESLERKMERELNLPPYFRPIMLIAVGYADPEGGIAYSAKKSPQSVFQKGF